MSVFNDEAPLETLVGEGKQYATLDELAKAIVHKENHIRKLETENAEYRNRDTDRQIQDRISPPAPVQVPQEPEAAPALSDDDLVERIKKITDEQDTKKIQEANAKAVEDRLVELFGDANKAKEYVKQKADELGVSVKFLQDTALQSPKAFFTTVGVNAPAPNGTPSASKGDVNPSALKTEPAAGTWEYYRNVRKTNPALYNTAGFQRQIMDAARRADADGKKFFT